MAAVPVLAAVLIVVVVDAIRGPKPPGMEHLMPDPLRPDHWYDPTEEVSPNDPHYHYKLMIRDYHPEHGDVIHPEHIPPLEPIPEPVDPIANPYAKRKHREHRVGGDDLTNRENILYQQVLAALKNINVTKELFLGNGIEQTASILGVLGLSAQDYEHLLTFIAKKKLIDTYGKKVKLAPNAPNKEWHAYKVVPKAYWVEHKDKLLQLIQDWQLIENCRLVDWMEGWRHQAWAWQLNHFKQVYDLTITVRLNETIAHYWEDLKKERRLRESIHEKELLRLFFDPQHTGLHMQQCNDCMDRYAFVFSETQRRVEDELHQLQYDKGFVESTGHGATTPRQSPHEDGGGDGVTSASHQSWAKRYEEKNHHHQTVHQRGDGTNVDPYKETRERLSKRSASEHDYASRYHPINNTDFIDALEEAIDQAMDKLDRTYQLTIVNGDIVHLLPTKSHLDQHFMKIKIVDPDRRMPKSLNLASVIKIHPELNEKGKNRAVLLRPNLEHAHSGTDIKVSHEDPSTTICKLNHYVSIAAQSAGQDQPHLALPRMRNLLFNLDRLPSNGPKTIVAYHDADLVIVHDMVQAMSSTMPAFMWESVMHYWREYNVEVLHDLPDGFWTPEEFSHALQHRKLIRFKGSDQQMRTKIVGRDFGSQNVNIEGSNVTTYVEPDSEVMHAFKRYMAKKIIGNLKNDLEPGAMVVITYAKKRCFDYHFHNGTVKVDFICQGVPHHPKKARANSGSKKKASREGGGPQFEIRGDKDKKKKTNKKKAGGKDEDGPRWWKDEDPDAKTNQNMRHHEQMEREKQDPTNPGVYEGTVPPARQRDHQNSEAGLIDFEETWTAGQHLYNDGEDFYTGGGEDGSQQPHRIFDPTGEEARRQFGVEPFFSTESVMYSEGCNIDHGKDVDHPSRVVPPEETQDPSWVQEKTTMAIEVYQWGESRPRDKEWIPYEKDALWSPMEEQHDHEMDEAIRKEDEEREEKERLKDPEYRRQKREEREERRRERERRKELGETNDEVEYGNPEDHLAEDDEDLDVNDVDPVELDEKDEKEMQDDDILVTDE